MAYRSILSLAALVIAYPVVSAGEGSVLEFDRFGRLQQLEHTRRATERGAASVGVCFGSCAVIACWPDDCASSTALIERGALPSPSSEPTSNISPWLNPPPVAADLAAQMLGHPVPLSWRVSETQALAATGLAGDAQVLLGFCRRLLASHTSMFGPSARMPTSRLASALASRLQAGTTTAGRRAFASELLLVGSRGGGAGNASERLRSRDEAEGGGGAAESEDGTQSSSKSECVLYLLSAMGHVRGVQAAAIGSGADAGNTRLAAILDARRRPRSPRPEGDEAVEDDNRVCEEGEGEDEGDFEFAVAASLEALLAAHLGSASRTASASAGALRALTAPPTQSEGPGAGERKGRETGEDLDHGDEADKEKARASVCAALNSMLAAIDSGALQLLCLAVGKNGVPQSSTAGVYLPSGVGPVSREVASRAIRKVAHERRWPGN
mmetsp:Transcript_71463/g.140331  ORF Transcript_71463/g.140331 Transcript_71463/m.140331 type:complete len:440 (+) Transcript_71463:226-1545(+)|eukprot:CAMPEP_0171959262 /NCGR_PEP_ID=MMETSP0993-20121228/146539_1 /TAXON_ID=483369 /ORGANISM="non described non described, Strain CCMP2098" /LENGTH=439 /DNA_ID=CAMNT_0012606727 /DNA_START=124 /DNA_END=1443 /DNA_ORIENTATION=+